VNNSVCVCDSGWSQSLEMSYFDEDGENKLNQTACNRNETVEHVIFGGALGVAALIFLMQVFITRKKIHLQHALPILFTTCFIITVAVYRLASEAALFGVDTAFTLLVNGLILGGVWVNVLDMQKYLVYLSRTYPFIMIKGSRIETVTRFFKTTFYPRLISSLVVTQLIWISLLLKKRSQQEYLIRAFLGFVSFTATIHLFSYWYVTYIVVQDLTTLKTAKTKNIVQSRQIIWIKEELPKIKRYRMQVILTKIGTILLLLLPLVSKFFFKNFIYFVFGYISPALIVLLNGVLKQYRKRQLRQSYSSDSGTDQRLSSGLSNKFMKPITSKSQDSTSSGKSLIKPNFSITINSL